MFLRMLGKMASTRLACRTFARLSYLSRPFSIAAKVPCKRLYGTVFKRIPNSGDICSGSLFSANECVVIPSRTFAGDHSHEDVPTGTMNVLKLYDKVDPSKVTLEARFIEDLGLDSLDVVEVIMAFEDEFGIEISDEEAEKILTVQQAADLIKHKLDAK